MRTSRRSGPVGLLLTHSFGIFAAIAGQRRQNYASLSSAPERDICTAMTDLSSHPSAPAVQENRAAFQRRRRCTGGSPRPCSGCFVLGNFGIVLWITLFSGYGDALGYHWNSFDNFLLGMGRLTAFLAGYLALIVVLLLARLPFLERIVGFDRLTIWHRWTGHAVIYLVLAHVVAHVWGYAKQAG